VDNTTQVLRVTHSLMRYHHNYSLFDFQLHKGFDETGELNY